MITSQAYYKSLSYSDLVELLAEATKKQKDAITFLERNATIESYRELINQIQIEIQHRIVEEERQIARLNIA